MSIYVYIVTCLSLVLSTFFRDVPCKWTNGYDFETALLLSVFLGMFGADRFYLGYPAIGLLKGHTIHHEHARKLGWWGSLRWCYSIISFLGSKGRQTVSNSRIFSISQPVQET